MYKGELESHSDDIKDLEGDVDMDNDGSDGTVDNGTIVVGPNPEVTEKAKKQCEKQLSLDFELGIIKDLLSKKKFKFVSWNENNKVINKASEYQVFV